MVLDTYNRTSRSAIQSRQRHKRVLAVRAMLSEVAWLAGRVLWHEGRVVWESRHRIISPSAADLALAQRRLNQIARHTRASRIVLGDTTAWLSDRNARLAVVKRLRVLNVPDLPALTHSARRHDPQAAQQLVALLAAEALCVNGLPASPAMALAGWGELAAAPLYVLLADESAPQAARALAALSLGANHRNSDDPYDAPRIPGAALREGWIGRAYAWGRRSGMPDNPALTVALLEVPDGEELARRCIKTGKVPAQIEVPGMLLREMLAAGTPTERVVEMAEALAATTSMAERVMRYRHELPAPYPRRRQQRLQEAWRLQEHRRRVLGDLTDILRKYVSDTADPEVVRLAVRFAHAILDLGEKTTLLSDALVNVLNAGVTLPAELQRPFLEVLVEANGRIWNSQGAHDSAAAGSLENWLTHRCEQDVPYIAKLLALTKGDVRIVCDAIEAELHRTLAHYKLRDPDMYRMTLTMVRDLDIQFGVWQLCDALTGFPNARSARSVFQPVIHILMQAPEGRRQELTDNLLSELPGSYEGVRVAVSRLMRFLPRLVDFAVSEAGQFIYFGSLVAGAKALYEGVPGQAATWLDWLLSYMADPQYKDEQAQSEGLPIGSSVSLAVALAGGDLAIFQAVFRAARQHSFDRHHDLMEKGIAALGRYPALRVGMARLFPRQPHRCLQLLVRLGLITRLGASVLAPLSELEAGWPDALGEGSPIPPGWQAVAEIAPELVPLVATYLRAQEMLGASPDLPPGVRRAIEQPGKWANELAHIEGMLESNPGRSDLAIRAGNLRARLGDPRLMLGVREELAGRLGQITAEAQFAAAENQVLACYRARLASLAGPLPTDLVLSQDLLNATLLAADIDQNRRLLLRLVRAHIRGDHRWVEQHPANLMFLRTLEARGVSAEAWQSARPRAFACEGVAGGRLRLRLERDPLHVLQMGNYFDTCLSFGGVNAFSTVANASEINKRVIYARDGTGRVVGRKLIAINSDGKLVGFNTYTMHTGEVGRNLRSVFRRYATDFAGECGLEMSDENSTVPKLFAEAWYDDGIVAWNADEVPHKRKS
ncbi:MAG TPA: hypothetical protein VGE45_04635 [Chloroflexia bacterium]